MQINIGWSDLKDFINTRNVPVQYIIANNSYYLFAADGPMEVTAQIPMDGSAVSDQTDFETNYKPTGNKSIVTTTAGKPFIDNSSSGTFTALSQTIVISTSGCSTVQYGSVDHSWVGTIITELSYDNGVNWFSCSTADTDPSTNLLMLEWGGTFTPAFNNDPWEVNCSGSTNFRLRVESFTSGSLDIVIVASAASGEAINPSNDRWNVGEISILNGVVLGATSGCSSCGIAVSGTWSGIIKFQASIDNINFFDIPVIDISTGFQIINITAGGNFLTPCGGYNSLQAIMYSYSSGTAIVTFDAGEGSNEGLRLIDPPTQYSHLTGNATTTLKTGVGRLHSISLNNNTTGGTIKVYDNTSGSGTLIMSLLLGTPSGGLLSSSGQQGPQFMGPFGPNGLTFTTGLTIVTTGSTSNDITAIYQ